MEAAAPWEMADDGKGYASVWALTPNLDPSRGMPAELLRFHITISTVNGRSGASPEEISAIAREIKALPAMLAALEAARDLIMAIQEHNPEFAYDTRVTGVREQAEVALAAAREEVQG